MLGPAVSESFEVWPENWLIVDFFLGLDNYWVKQIVGRRIHFHSLDHSGIDRLSKTLGVKKKKRAELFNGILIMERAALEVLNE